MDIPVHKQTVYFTYRPSRNTPIRSKFAGRLVQAAGALRQSSVLSAAEATNLNRPMPVVLRVRVQERPASQVVSH